MSAAGQQKNYSLLRSRMATDGDSSLAPLDREIVLETVKQNGRALGYASAALKDDREIVLEAVKQDGYALRFASAALQDDREIVDYAGGPCEWDY